MARRSAMRSCSWPCSRCAYPHRMRFQSRITAICNLAAAAPGQQPCQGTPRSVAALSSESVGLAGPELTPQHGFRGLFGAPALAQRVTASPLAAGRTLRGHGVWRVCSAAAWRPLRDEQQDWPCHVPPQGCPVPYTALLRPASALGTHPQRCCPTKCKRRASS